MEVYNIHKTFNDVKLMLYSLYKFDSRFDNVVIVLGYNILENANISVADIRKKHPGCKLIGYQLEQLFKGSMWDRRKNIEILTQFDAIWDYDEQNMEYLFSKYNINSTLHTLKYAPHLTTMPLLTPNEHNIDILFIGEVQSRREKIIKSIKKANPDRKIVTTKEIGYIWGDELHKYTQRSKIVLNLHMYEQNRLEQVRIFHLLANHKCVVSEHSDVNYFEKSIAMADKDKLGVLCKDLLDSDDWYKYASHSLKHLVLCNTKY